ncbi:hypothetical protein O181_052091 [Austropuccinia psidii MF-1]|uniref:Integrase catalytic domain-containing protein n=1 Tax=Austropuccinia psidii MF-1 TaxID=1389203 RepID=A0A9Q3E4Y3_9BASI|nr:hypothetical protein [Austropuccinia psidii MF-1]
MIKIQEPSRHCENFHMDLVAGLPPGGDRSYNSFLVIFESERDTKFTSALWKNPYQLFGTKLSFYTAYHPQTDGLAEIMIQTLENMVRRFCAYDLELKDSYGLTPDGGTLLPAFELAYNTLIHASTNQTSTIIEKGWNPKLPQDFLRKDLVELKNTAVSFKGMLEKARKHA